MPAHVPRYELERGTSISSTGTEDKPGAAALQEDPSETKARPHLTAKQKRQVEKRRHTKKLVGAHSCRDLRKQRQGKDGGGPDVAPVPAVS